MRFNWHYPEGVEIDSPGSRAKRAHPGFRDVARTATPKGLDTDFGSTRHDATLSGLEPIGDRAPGCARSARDPGLPGATPSGSMKNHSFSLHDDNSQLKLRRTKRSVSPDSQRLGGEHRSRKTALARAG